MINANRLRKNPEELLYFSSDAFKIILDIIEENIQKSVDIGFYDFHISTKKIKDHHFVVNDILIMKQLIRSLSIEFLSNNYDVHYNSYILDGTEIIALRVKWL